MKHFKREQYITVVSINEDFPSCFWTAQSVEQLRLTAESAHLHRFCSSQTSLFYHLLYPTTWTISLIFFDCHTARLILTSDSTVEAGVARYFRARVTSLLWHLLCAHRYCKGHCSRLMLGTALYLARGLDSSDVSSSDSVSEPNIGDQIYLVALIQHLSDVEPRSLLESCLMFLKLQLFLL